MANFRTPEFRLSFPNITKQKKNMKTGEDAGYGISAIIPKDGKGTKDFLEELRTEVRNAIKAKFCDAIPAPLRK